MKQFTLYNPRQPLARQQLLKKFDKPQSEYDAYFIREDNHLLVYEEKFHTYPLTSSRRPGETKLIADQFEMPLSGVRWFIDVIEQRFFKSPEEGGLPADKISYEDIVDGEELHVMRVVYAGCDHPGYDITNGSRYSYISSRSLQTLALSDPWLFRDGLMGFLKEIASQYEAGRL
ncbi:hypothetical protein ACSV5M_13155 [Cellvibrio sp. ARAG 10.3]|uniref:hypothetical protein n=1 Tax=Cellvibrio sp. ARAG 10.3 TaxID=3451358 RepID=UPI003F46FD67